MLQFFTARRRRQAGEWLIELLIVVFGVLIALYAQQWASDRQSRRAAADAETRIRAEVYQNAFNEAERIGLHRCLQDRLGQIAERLNSGANDWPAFAYPYTDNDLFLVRRIYRTPSRGWTDDAYRGALSSGALESVSPERRALWAGLYRQSAKSQELNTEEHALAPELNSLSLDAAVTPGDRRALLQTVAKLDRYNGLMVVIARQQFAGIKELGYRLTKDEVADVQKNLYLADGGGSNSSVPRMRTIYGQCVDPTAYKLFDPALRTP